VRVGKGIERTGWVEGSGGMKGEGREGLVKLVVTIDVVDQHSLGLWTLDHPPWILVKEVCFRKLVARCSDIECGLKIELKAS